MRVLLVIGILAASVRFNLPAQTEPTFIAVSIKPNADPPNYSETRQLTTGRVHFIHVGLQTLILDAFRIRDYQLFFADGLKTGMWDVEATMPPDSSPEQVASMLRMMLKERFGLQTHFEKRAIPVYILTSVDGNKLRPATDPPGRLALDGTSTTFRIYGRGPMSGLANLLGRQVGHPVLDRTGLEGIYQISLEYSRDVAMENSDGQDALSAPSLFTALRDKLGLKLELRKEDTDCLVVDKVALTATPN